MGDVDDPEIFAAQPLWEWQQTDQGKWVMKNCSDPQYKICADASWIGHQIEVYGPLSEEQATWWELKWAHVKA